MPEAQTTHLVITDVIRKSEDVTLFLLGACDSKPISYQAGQFLTFIFEDEFGEIRRSYSLSSSPASDEPLAIAVKRIPNGRCSRWFADRARAGDEIKSLLPAGQFVLPEKQPGDYQYIFFAAGVGITPIFSLIKTILYRLERTRIVLFYSNSTIATTVFYKELVALQEQFRDWFQIEWFFSDSKNLNRARLNKESLPQWVSPYLAEGPATLFYLCGPYNYMRMVTYGLEEMGFKQEVIRKEIFDTSRPVLKLVPPDQEPHHVTVYVNTVPYRFETRYPQTILQAARKAGLSLPYSCETGKCGACAQQCTVGNVWMSYNEVLTDKELIAGKVLTCTGYPIGGDVILRGE